MIIYDMLDSVVGAICKALGKPEDQIKLVLMLLLNLPLGLFMNVCLPQIPLVRHIYSITLGLLIQYYLYADTMYHVVLMAYPCYFMMMFLPRNKQQYYVTVYLLVYNCYLHISSMIRDYGGYNMDITSYTMLLFCKLWGMSWAYMDGAKAAKYTIVKGKIESPLTADQAKWCVQDMPSFLEFNSFVFFFAGCIVGPFFEFADYKNFIDMTGQYAKAPRGYPEGLQSLKPALIRLGEGLIYMVINIAGLIYGYDTAFCGTPEWLTQPFLSNVWFYCIAMQIRKFMFYIPWCFIDSAMISCGVAYNSNHEKKGAAPTWDRIVSVYVWIIEMDPSPPKKMIGWNHCMHLWLKNYVALRLVKKGERLTTAANLITFAMSALWHGFYPFYYVMFFMAALYSETCKDIYRSAILFDFNPPWLNYLIAQLLSTVLMNYFGVSLAMLTFEKGGNFMRGTYSFVFILVVASFAFVKMSGMVGYAKKVAEKRKALTAGAESKKDR